MRDAQWVRSGHRTTRDLDELAEVATDELEYLTETAHTVAVVDGHVEVTFTGTTLHLQSYAVRPIP